MCFFFQCLATCWLELLCSTGLWSLGLALLARPELKAAEQCWEITLAFHFDSPFQAWIFCSLLSASFDVYFYFWFWFWFWFDGIMLFTASNNNKQFRMQSIRPLGQGPPDPAQWAACKPSSENSNT